MCSVLAQFADFSSCFYHGLIGVLLELHEAHPGHVLKLWLGVVVVVLRGGGGAAVDRRRGRAQRLLAVHLARHHVVRLKQRLQTNN